MTLKQKRACEPFIKANFIALRFALHSLSHKVISETRRRISGERDRKLDNAFLGSSSLSKPFGSSKMSYPARIIYKLASYRSMLAIPSGLKRRLIGGNIMTYCSNIENKNHHADKQQSLVKHAGDWSRTRSKVNQRLTWEPELGGDLYLVTLVQGGSIHQTKELQHVQG